VQSGTIKLKDLFNGDRIFNIPKYQRTYAWRDENLEYFLDDLINQRGEKSYFLGTLLFHQKEDRGEYEIIDVVDGQQRLTTIIIFINVIINLLSSTHSSKITKKTFKRYIYDDENYTLELENEDSAFLHNYIFQENNISTFETPSQQRLYKAKGYFKKTLSQLDIEKVEQVYEVLINADVIIYIVNKISDATQIFELLNDRGRQLTRLEGIKSFLMYRIGCLNLKDDGEQSINVIQNSFSSIYRLIEKNDINENDLLRYHTIAFEKSKTEDYNAPHKFIKNKINRLFEKNKDDIEIKNEIIEYVKRLQNSFSIFSDIKNNIMKCKKLDDFIMIGRINPFYPLMLKVYTDTPDSFCKFSKNLVKFTFRASLVSLRSNGETDFYKWIRDNDFGYKDIKIPFKNNWWYIEDRVERILVECRNFYKKGCISKSLTKYILFSYENYLRQEKGYPLLSKENYFSTDNREKFSIEHITAQRAKNIDFNENFNEEYLHALGNLVLDTTSSNSRKGNKNVEDKMSEFIKAPIMSQNKINEINIDWDNIEKVKEFIDKRNNEIIDFIRNNLM